MNCVLVSKQLTISLHHLRGMRAWCEYEWRNSRVRGMSNARLHPVPRMRQQYLLFMGCGYVLQSWHFDCAVSSSHHFIFCKCAANVTIAPPRPSSKAYYLNDKPLMRLMMAGDKVVE